MKAISSTWLQTTSHLKYYSYRICYPNQACLGSLESQLQGTSTYLIVGSTPKLVRSYATKPERFCEIAFKFQAPNTILLTSILSKYPKHPTHSPSFHHLLKLIILLLPLLRKTTQEKDLPKTPLPQAFRDPSLSLFSLSNGSCGNLSL